MLKHGSGESGVSALEKSQGERAAALHVRVFEYHLPVEQAHHTVGVAGIVLGVCDHNDGRAGLVQLGQQLHYFVAVAGIEVTSRFVGQYQARAVYYSAGHGYAL
jgi:hypothetical protein